MQLHQLFNNYDYSRDLMYAKHLINVITYSDIKIQIHYTDNKLLSILQWQSQVSNDDIALGHIFIWLYSSYLTLTGWGCQWPLSCWIWASG